MKTLTKAEEQVMQVLWGLQKGFLKDILEHCPEPRPHSNTVATLLKIRVDKGFGLSERKGRNNVPPAKSAKAGQATKSLARREKSHLEAPPPRPVCRFLRMTK